MAWVTMAFVRFADFNGRSRRLEYWVFWAVLLIAQLIATYIDRALGRGPLVGGMGILALLANLTLLVPAVSVTFRRLHDLGRSGAWSLLLGIPFLAWQIWPRSSAVSLILLVGALALLVLTVQPGQAGRNAYGDNPKGDLPEPVAEADSAG